MSTYYFISDPSISTQGVVANYITVKSPTASYTASKTGVASDNKIERVVPIDTGDTAICKVVAERLLERWGEEQFSVTGDIAFNVGLEFKEKVHLVIPTAGIDGNYILQRKEHSIGNFATTVTLGDIILSENELVARILQDLGG